MNEENTGNGRDRRRHDCRTRADGCARHSGNRSNGRTRNKSGGTNRRRRNTRNRSNGG